MLFDSDTISTDGVEFAERKHSACVLYRIRDREMSYNLSAADVDFYGRTSTFSVGRFGG